jgi:hypothetical protein
VQVPQGGRTSVTTRAIDTNDGADDQMDQTWRGPIGDLDAMLGAAVALIETWKRRNRARSNPASPR